MGDSFGAILEQCDEQGKPLPSQIQDHLDQREPWMDFYLGAYSDLAGDRGSGNRVTWMAMDRYAERYEFDPDFVPWFIRCIRAIDNEYLEVSRAEQKREQAAMEAKAKQGVRR